MSKELETSFDKVFFFVFLGLVASSIFMTSVFKHLLFYFVPILFLIKKLVFRGSFLKEVFFTRTPKLSLIVWQVTFLPSVIALLQGNPNLLKDHNLQWLSFDNSWVILFCFALSNYFLSQGLCEKLKMDKAFYALSAFLFGFLIDFAYAVLKWINSGFAVENRWQGSAGNPQLWAVQLSIALLIWVLVRKDLDKYFNNSFVSSFLIVLIASGIVLTGSMSNFIGLFFASLSFVIPSAIFVLVLAFAYVILTNYYVINFLTGSEPDINSLKSSLNIVAHKFLPRIRLWLKLIKDLPSQNFNPLLGMGLENYNAFIETATNAKHQNAHSIYAHNYFINGLLGIYIHLIALFNAFKDLMKNKYLLAIFVFVITSSVFDCALTYLEVQLVFWLSLPLMLSRILKSS